MAKIIDLTGKKFGRLTFVNRVKGDQGAAYFKCDCGVEKRYYINNVKRGTTSSCGCYNRELCKSRRLNTTPSLSRINGVQNPLYAVFRCMLYRCYNKKSNRYENYGARGIVVCEEWRGNFHSFYNWAMSAGYKQGLEIDRRDVNKDYSPDNCRFVTSLENARNKVNTLYYEYQGKKMPLKEIAEIVGIKYKTLFSRIKYQGLDIKEATSRCLK